MAHQEIIERRSGTSVFVRLPISRGRRYRTGWSGLYIVDRVKLGNDFLRLVRQGRFQGVEDTGEKKDGGRVYRKLR